MLKRLFIGTAIFLFAVLGLMDVMGQQQPKPRSREQLQQEYLDGLCDVAKGQVKALQAVNEIQRQQIEELSVKLAASEVKP